MELEQRVQVLEYEMKILKNELQRTLLDIQEQILAHYYPSLRADDSAPTEATMQTFEAVRAKQAAMAEAGEEVALPMVKPALAAEAASVVKPVALDASRTKPTQAASSVAPRLTEWVSSSVATIGRMYTVRLIELYSHRGLIAGETADALIRLAALGKDAAPRQVPVNKLLDALLKLNEQLGRAADIEESLALIEEAKLA